MPHFFSSNILKLLLLLAMALVFAACGSETPPDPDLIVNPLQKVLSSPVMGQPETYRVESVKENWGKSKGDRYQMDVEVKIRVMKDTDCKLDKLKGTFRNCGPGLKAGDFIYLTMTREFIKVNGRWLLE